MRSILSTLAILFAITVGYVGFAEDASAFGRGRHGAGCSSAHAQASCSDAYAGCAGEDAWYWGKRRDERKAKRAARYAGYYGCSEPAAASCSEPSSYSAAPPAACPCNCADCTCNRATPAAAADEAAPEPLTVSGHYGMRRVCENGVCRYVRVWVPAT
jgi:hypothetical protein